MPGSHLELKSSFGDQTLSRLRFALHGTHNATETASLRDEGLRFIEGKPILSMNLVEARQEMGRLQAAGNGMGEPGSLMVCAVPANLHLGYGVFTTAYIDRAQKQVTGAPLRYMGGRSNLALYVAADTEASRVHIEAEVANGYDLELRPPYILEPQFVVGSFVTSPLFGNILQQLDVGIRSMQVLEFDRLERSLTDSMEPSIPANGVLVPTAVRDLIFGTVESVIISELRTMHFQTLRALGYTFSDGYQEVQVLPEYDVAQQRGRVDEFERRLASSNLFVAELAWLKEYATHVLDLMRIELEGAQLEALPD
ncbi:MAG: hypothetical protein JWN01_874 [Patescibacteria group bacterium]|nr:hypothetical protein [Patescibacteria group bacterium]